jgi:chromosome segregation ATPase
LNVIDARCIPNEIVQKLKAFTTNRVFLAKELVEYDQEIEKAIDYVFGQVVSYFSLVFKEDL